MPSFNNVGYVQQILKKGGVLLSLPTICDSLEKKIYLRWTKRHLMMLSQGSYGLYPAAKVMFRVNIRKTKIVHSLVLSHAFTCRVLVCFASHVFIFFVVGKELMQSVRAALQSFPKYSVNSKVSD